MNYKDMNIIKIKLFVNNVALVTTAYLANVFITLCLRMWHVSQPI